MVRLEGPVTQASLHVRPKAGPRDATATMSPSTGLFHAALSYCLPLTACRLMRVAFEGTTRKAQTTEIPAVVLS